MLLWATLIALALWLAAAAFLWLSQERLIFHPRPVAAEVRSQLANFELVVPTANDIQLAGWAFPVTEASGAVFFWGGNSQEISTAVAQLPDQLGLAAAGTNYRGFGDSKGQPTAAALRADALVAFDAAVAHLGIPPQRWIVIGRSLGSHMAAYLAAHRPVAGVVLITPFDSVTNVAARLYPLFPVRLMLRHPFDTVAETAQITAPVLIVKASHDRVVPHASTARLVAGWLGNGSVAEVTILDTDHVNIDNNTQFWDELRKFTEQVFDAQSQPSGVRDY